MKFLLWKYLGLVVALMMLVTLSISIFVTDIQAAEPGEPLSVHMIGVGEYKPVESLTLLKSYLEERYKITCTTSIGKRGNQPLSNLEALKSAELMAIFARRTKLPEERMVIFRNHWQQGKPIVDIWTIEKLVHQGNFILAVDLRGIGETRTTGSDVTISYLLGKSLVGMRAEDVLITGRVLSEWESKDEPPDVHLIASGVAVAPAIHATALESKLFASLRVNGDTPSWSDVVRNPITGRMSDTVHGALTAYDLPDLVASYRSSRKQDSQP